VLIRALQRPESLAIGSWVLVGYAVITFWALPSLIITSLNEVVYIAWRDLARIHPVVKVGKPVNKLIRIEGSFKSLRPITFCLILCKTLGKRIM
jgi:hypothetical protein